MAGAGGGGATVAGDLLVLASVAGSAAFIVLQPRLLDGRDPAAVTAVQLGAGRARRAAGRAARRGRCRPRRPTAAPVVAVAGLALAGTALPFWLFAFGQARVPAQLAGAFVNLEPLVGAQRAGWCSARPPRPASWPAPPPCVLAADRRARGDARPRPPSFAGATGAR